jgi:ribosomal protein S18 acetylase RimI-like enzyme
MLIRKADIKDAEAIFELNRDGLGQTYDFSKTLERLLFLIDKQEHYILVAEIDTNIVGYIHAGDYDVTYSDHLKNIMGIAVQTEYRRKGVGKELLFAVEEWAKEDGAIGVRLVSGASRKQAHEFYSACGYSKNKEQLNFSKIFN